MQSDIGQHAESRREMLRTSIRWTVGTGLAVLSVALVGRGVIKAPSGLPCRRPIICGRCAVRSWCRLPQALAAPDRQKG